MAGAGGGFGVGCRGFAGPVTGKTASRPIGEFDQIDLLALAVSGGFQEVDDAQKARAAGEVRGYVGKVDLADRAHLDKARPQGIATADLDARAMPDADAARDLAPHDPVAQFLGEGHGRGVRVLGLGRVTMAPPQGFGFP